jgi:hypothetical protein
MRPTREGPNNLVDSGLWCRQKSKKKVLKVPRRQKFYIVGSKRMKYTWIFLIKKAVEAERKERGTEVPWLTLSCLWEKLADSWRWKKTALGYIWTEMGTLSFHAFWVLDFFSPVSVCVSWAGRWYEPARRGPREEGRGGENSETMTLLSTISTYPLWISTLGTLDYTLRLVETWIRVLSWLGARGSCL